MALIPSELSLFLQSHWALFENGEVQEYSVDGVNGSGWKFIPLHGFEWRVYEHFHPESDLDGRLIDWSTVEERSSVGI